jgi:hypothetical protein
LRKYILRILKKMVYVDSQGQRSGEAAVEPSVVYAEVTLLKRIDYLSDEINRQSEVMTNLSARVDKLIARWEKMESKVPVCCNYFTTRGTNNWQMKKYSEEM